MADTKQTKTKRTKSQMFDTKTTDAAAESPILRLPAELRNTIYHMVLVDRPYINVTNFSEATPEPGLLATCKQIRDESLKMYYGANTFFCSSMLYFTYNRTGLGRWLMRINDDHRQMINHVLLRCSHTGVSDELTWSRHLDIQRHANIYYAAAEKHVHSLVGVGVRHEGIKFAAQDTLDSTEDAKQKLYKEGGEVAIYKLVNTPYKDVIA